MKNKILNNGLIFGFMAVLSLSLFSPIKAYGASYSSDEGTKDLVVDKKVRSIEDAQYYDNIESSKYTFFEKDIIEFQVKVQNVGTEVMYNINVKDMLPKYLSLVFYPGKFDDDQDIIEWNIDQLNAGESKTYLIRAKINDSSKLNVLTKQTNKAEACGAGECDADNSSYYIGKISVPATGASDILIKTVAVISVAGLGFAVRKKARGY